MSDETSPAKSLLQSQWWEHLTWLAKHGGGDEVADANCWRDTKPHLAALLNVVHMAVFVDAQVEIEGGSVKRGRLDLPQPVALALLELRSALSELKS